MIKRETLFIFLLLTPLWLFGQEDVKERKIELATSLSFASPIAYTQYNHTNFNTTIIHSDLLLAELNIGVNVKQRLKPYIALQLQLKNFQYDPNTKLIIPQHQLGIGVQYKVFVQNNWKLSIMGDSGFTRGFFSYIPSNTVYYQARLEAAYKFEKSCILLRAGSTYIREEDSTIAIKRIFKRKIDLGYAFRF